MGKIKQATSTYLNSSRHYLRPIPHDLSSQTVCRFFETRAKITPKVAKDTRRRAHASGAYPHARLSVPARTESFDRGLSSPRSPRDPYKKRS